MPIAQEQRPAMPASRQGGGGGGGSGRGRSKAASSSSKRAAGSRADYLQDDFDDDDGGGGGGGVCLPAPPGTGSGAVEPAPTSSGSSRKRRPRKIAPAVPAAAPAPVTGDAAPTAAASAAANKAGIDGEVEALKSKVLAIEAQVQELLQRPPGPGKKAARRRAAKNGKGKARKDEAEAGEKELEDDEGEEEEGEVMAAARADSTRHEEMGKLQQELGEARAELATLRRTRRTLSTGTGDAATAVLHTNNDSHDNHDNDVADDGDDVEDIPRLEGPGLAEVGRSSRPQPPGRSVTLSGSYRIPVPAGVSDADMDALGRGIRSAQNIARSFLDSRRSSRGRQGDEDSRTQATGREERTTGRAGKETWSEWLGGYSMSIAKSIDGMRISSSVEGVPRARPRQRQVLEAPAADTVRTRRRKPQKLEVRGRKRPGMAEAGRAISESQVAGLLA